jgi:hypothetical protein
MIEQSGKTERIAMIGFDRPLDNPETIQCRSALVHTPNNTTRKLLSRFEEFTMRS